MLLRVHFIIATLLFISQTAHAHVPYLICELKTSSASLTTKKIYPTRSSVLTQVSAHQFADIKYDSGRDIARIELVYMPHEPFTFGEKVQSRIELKLVNGAASTELSGVPDSLRVTCETH